jgi:tetratricopeptide (TPR) repeat protein
MAPSAMKTHMDACPDLETLAAYLDGQLSERERTVIAGHLAECETCYFVFTEAAQTRALKAPATNNATAEPVSAWKWLATPKIAWSSAVGLAAAACLLLAAGTGIIPWRNSDSAELRALVTAVGTERTIEPRLTGGFGYGPVRGIVRGSDPLTPMISPDVRIAAAELEKASASTRSAAALRERGVAALVVGEIDRGVATLEEAANVRPSDARVQSDLAAAYLARAARSAQPDDVTKALAAANRAINANRTLPEALFNRAAALERLGMIAEARDAWRAFLVIDDQSGWADEARTNLRTLEERR